MNIWKPSLLTASALAGQLWVRKMFVTLSDKIRFEFAAAIFSRGRIVAWKKERRSSSSMYGYPNLLDLRILSFNEGLAPAFGSLDEEVVDGGLCFEEKLVGAELWLGASAFWAG